MAQPPASGADWARVWDLFHEAVDRSPVDREAFLEEACGSDPELRREVEGLLVADAVSRSPLDKPAVHRVAAQEDVVPTEELPSRARPFSPGEVLADRFEIIRVLGRGGMGVAYEAQDRERGMAVALKTLRPGLTADPEAHDRFRREINLALQVTHPNVCRLHDFFRHLETRDEQEVETVFLSMELLPGETLANRLQREGPMETDEALLYWFSVNVTGLVFG